MTFTIISTALFVLAAFWCGLAYGRARERERTRRALENYVRKYGR